MGPPTTPYNSLWSRGVSSPTQKNNVWSSKDERCERCVRVHGVQTTSAGSFLRELATPPPFLLSWSEYHSVTARCACKTPWIMLPDHPTFATPDTHDAVHTPRACPVRPVCRGSPRYARVQSIKAGHARFARFARFAWACPGEPPQATASPGKPGDLDAYSNSTGCPGPRKPAPCP